uniref:mRNA (guanine-N(7))-methyltransferase n=1 Tax=Trypanosoma congolense (strain IL3000) TaxID=1068625 RepID=G0UPM1_TRYCI|nr:unnamed protein product [Trypanosoma congolense IL3000]
MIWPNSLSQLCDSAPQLVGGPLLLPVDEEFVQAVHHMPAAGGDHASSGSGFVAAHRSLLARNRGRKLASYNYVAKPIQLGVPHLIYDYPAAAVVGTHGDEFVGPLCSPIRKAHADVLRSERYFVTEKSDGMRVMLVSLTAPLVPSWSIGDGTGDLKRVGHLDDVMALEEARDGFNSDGSTGGGAHPPIRLSFGTFTVECGPEKVMGGDVECFSLRRCQSSDSSPQGEASPSVRAERRVRGRQMAYCFDRSMDCAYLLLEERAVPSVESFAVDAELMFVVRERQNSSARVLLGCFDLFRYSTSSPAPRNVLLTRAATSVRHAKLREEIIGPMEALQNGAVGTSVLRIFAKDMFPLEKFGDCAMRLVRDNDAEQAGRVAYLYDGPHGWTKSDGFIFTPERFDIVQGASKTQLKWKWPSMLSVDWCITAFEGQNNLFLVDSYFRKKRFGHQPDSHGRVRLSSKMTLLNPNMLPVPTRNAVVAECSFDKQRRCWSIDRLRSDRTEPNSVVTIISVLESLVEDITLAVLINLIGMKDSSQSLQWAQELERAQDEESNVNCQLTSQISGEERERKMCQFTLRATQLQGQGEHELYLYWAVRLQSQKTHIPCIHCRVSDCIGLGFTCPREDETSRLTDHLYVALANAGGSWAWSDFTVEATFDGRVGRWNIVSINPNGDNRKSTCVGVIQYLQWLLQRGGSELPPAVDETCSSGLQQLLPKVQEPASPEVKLVNKHYACKTKELSKGKNRSILRRYNNWIKGVLICTSLSYLKTNSSCGKGSDNDGFAVADLCCGRGGDLLKWKAQRPKLLFMADSCLEALAEGAARYCVSKGLSLKVVLQDKNDAGVPAHFCVLDVFDQNGALDAKLGEFLNQTHDGIKLDVVSCQFSLHYGCSTEERMRAFLAAVSGNLRTGGIFVGTTVDDAELAHRLRERGPVFGNEIYNVRFPSEGLPEDTFGVGYLVTFESSVKELPEYVVPWRRFVALCAEHNLRLVECCGFLEYGEMHYNSPLGRELRDTIAKDGKRNSDGHLKLQLSPEETDAVSLFKTFLFVKV